MQIFYYIGLILSSLIIILGLIIIIGTFRGWRLRNSFNENKLFIQIWQIIQGLICIIIGLILIVLAINRLKS